MPKASDKRKSISALTAAWPCKTRDSITRLMPICAEKAVTLTSRSSSQPVSNSPGCAGLCMFMMCLSVVIQIVQQLNVFFGAVAVAVADGVGQRHFQHLCGVGGSLGAPVAER